ncbi:HAD-IIIC family phosphatase [Jiella pacifica]|uniref:HAD-IIIC family phosphatase n=1 Tax=Jiella pacifica TaxID=2696469 RepID=A0A6N9T424_9HYPH|nr:HAD-IIIC family phosphatase [Jiella pacifica]NDW06010.1 HAD-IIIC family phosphatase [Jiella pacifica]
MSATETLEHRKEKAKSVKLVVFDLDNTLWDGTLLEDGDVRLKPSILPLFEELDRRGVLISVASRNDADLALAKLEAFGLVDYVLHPQIGWGAKSQAVATIVAALNLGFDTVAFVDDEPFERGEVHHALPEVRVIDGRAVEEIADRPDFMPAVITGESRLRRQMYRAEIRRGEVEAQSSEPTQAFLRSLDMRFTILEAREEDLLRAEELTLRTNQLNTTGRTYDLEALDAMRLSPDHLVLVARLEDRYGPYGTIGLAVVDIDERVWTIRLLLMSCRVISRGVGSIMMNYIRNRARDAGVGLEADFVSNGRNRMMYATYKFSGFSEIARDGACVRLSCDLSVPAEYPETVQLSLPPDRPR